MGDIQQILQDNALLKATILLKDEQILLKDEQILLKDEELKRKQERIPVSYTHLTLPTKRIV